MLALLRTPRWVGLTVALLVAVVGFLLLGAWQWSSAFARPSVDLQNLFYALEWWFVAGLVVVLYLRELRDVRRTAADPTTPGPRLNRPQPPLPTRRLSTAAAPVVDDDDEEVAAYNAYLAWLAANPRR